MIIRIIPYEKEHQPIFKQLNLEWLDHYHLTESHDLLILDDPHANIIEGGGFIWLAEADGQIVGSAALINEHDGVYELAKMTVALAYRGKGISKLLIEACLEKARQLHAKKLILFSNHQLKTALGIYAQFGFIQVPVEDSPFLTADVKMEINLDS